MAAVPSSAFIPGRSAFTQHKQIPSIGYFSQSHRHPPPSRRVSFTVHAAKPPPGVVIPKVEPKFQSPFLGFTKTAEVWNSRACMIGLIGTFIVELILNKGILQLIGVDIGKGLDLPL